MIKFSKVTILYICCIWVVILDVSFAQTWNTYLDSATYYEKNREYKNLLSVIDKIYISCPDTQKKDSITYQLFVWKYKQQSYLGYNKTKAYYAYKLADFSKNIYGETHSKHLSDKIQTASFLIHETARLDSLSDQLLNICKKEFYSKTFVYPNAVLLRANYYERITNYAEAERLYLQAMQLYKEQKDTSGYYAAKSKLAYFYKIIGSYEKAEKLLKENIAGYKKPYPLPFYEDIENLAGVYQKMKKYNRAESLFKSVILFYERAFGKSSIYYGAGINNLGLVYDLTGRYEQAEKCFRESLPVIEKNSGKDTRNYATTLNNLAICLKNQKKYKEAEPLYLEVLAIRKRILGRNHPDYNNILNNIAVFYELTKQYKKADSFYVEMIQRVVKTLLSNFKNLNEKEKKDYLYDHAVYLNNFMAHCFKRSGSVKKFDSLFNPIFLEYAYNHQLTTKGILINNMQKLKKHIENNNTNIQSTFKEWNTLRNQIANYHKLNTEQQKEKNINIDLLEKQADSLEKELSYQSPDFYELVQKQEITWKNVQKKLKKNEASIELVRIPIRDSLYYLAYIVTAQCTQPKAISVPDAFKLEKEYLNNYRRSIKSKVMDTLSYQHYWKPIHEYLKTNKVKKVYLSCDGVYHQVNINTLYISPKTPVIDEMDIFYMTNTRDLATEKKIKLSKELVLLGNPDFKLNTPDSIRNRGEVIAALPGTQEEILNITKIAEKKSWKTFVYMQEKANETALKKVQTPRILHIATHGFFHDNPQQNSMLNSGLLFSGAENTLYNQKYTNESDEDGILTAYEAMNLELDGTELVVLSACETGLGATYHTTSGIYGLQRAFKVAGAKHLIMSLWKVSDSATQLLMKTFYYYWLDKKIPVHEAFSKAQKKLKETYPEPYFWGSFILME
jgi:CHAT domain-containing protein/Flp pilus assembly protein TadD